MRHNYSLTEETIKVLNGNCPKVADEMNVSPTYVYGVIESTNPDPFSYFVAMYAAAVRAGCDVTPWMAKLAEIQARYRSEGKPLTDSLTNKLKEEATTNTLIVDAIADGKITESERKPILRAVAVERTTLDVIESQVSGEIRSFAKAAVNKRRNVA